MRLLQPILAIIAVLFVGLFVATYFHLYFLLPNFDKVLHFLGGLAATWFLLVYLSDDMRRSSPLSRFLLLVGTTALIGLLWEFAEYTSSHYLGAFPLIQKYFSGGDLFDTLTDLAFDILGALPIAFATLTKNKSS